MTCSWASEDIQPYSNVVYLQNTDDCCICLFGCCIVRVALTVELMMQFRTTAVTLVTQKLQAELINHSADACSTVVLKAWIGIGLDGMDGWLSGAHNTLKTGVAQRCYRWDWMDWMGWMVLPMG